MKFTGEVSLGALIQIIMFLAAIVGVSLKMGKIEQKVDMMWRWFENHVLSASEREDARRASAGGD